MVGFIILLAWTVIGSREYIVVASRDARTAGIAQPGIDIGALAARLHVAGVGHILFGYLEGQRTRLPDVAWLGRHGNVLVTLPRLDLVDFAQLLGFSHILQHLCDSQDVDVGTVKGEENEEIISDLRTFFLVIFFKYVKPPILSLVCVRQDCPRMY